MSLRTFVLAGMLCAPAAPALAQSPAPAPQAPGAQPQAAAPALGVIASGAAQGGVRRCLPRIDQLTNFLLAGSVNSAMIFISPRDPDGSQSSISFEVQNGNLLSYMDAAFAPTVVGCDAMYQAVTYWHTNCEQVAKTNFEGFPRISPLRQYIAVLDGGPTAKVFLMPAGSGCVSIKKESVN